MEHLDQHSKQLNSLLALQKREKAPEDLKKTIMAEISALPTPVATRRSRIKWVFIPVILILSACLFIALSQIGWMGWALPDFNGLNLPFQLNMKIPTGPWMYYLGGGILIMWFYLSANYFLDKIFNR